MTDYSPMEQYWIWLSAVEGVGPKKFDQLIERFGSARAVWDAAPDADLRFLGSAASRNLRKARDERVFYQIFAQMENTGQRAITKLSKDYPERLNNIFDPPPTLYVIGEANLNPRRAIGVVGSRRCTSDGQRAARDFSETLASEGVAVISGLARGTDTSAHKGAIAGGGVTIAAMGSGADVIYPPENDKLAKKIIETGGALVTEYPPGTQPLAGNFPARNRIISGMSDGVLLVEGAQASGALITVNFAIEHGREVFAVPGSIYSPLSATPNKLICEGAIPAVSAYDIIKAMKWERAQKAVKRAEKRLQLDGEEARVAEPLFEQSLTISELENITGMKVDALKSHLTMLLLRGIIVEQPGGRYRAYK